MRAEKIETLIEILKQKQRFTLVEAEEIARQIASAQAAPYITVEAISRLAQQTKLKIELK